MAHSVLRNMGMTPQSLTEAIKQSLPTAIGTATGAALGPTILAHLPTILSYVIPAVASAVGLYLGYEGYKEYKEGSKEKKELLNYFDKELLPPLQEKDKSEKEIKDIKVVWEALANFATIGFHPDVIPDYHNVFRKISPEVFEQVYQIAQKEGLGEKYIELLKMFPKIDSIVTTLESIEAQNKTATPSGSTLTFSAEPAPAPTETVTTVFPPPANEVSPENEPAQASPLSEFIVEKPAKKEKEAFPPASNNYTNYYNFTINATPLPGETPEEMAKRIASQILQQLEETQVNDTRNRSAGQ